MFFNSFRVSTVDSVMNRELENKEPPHLFFKEDWFEKNASWIGDIMDREYKNVYFVVSTIISHDYFIRWSGEQKRNEKEENKQESNKKFIELSCPSLSLFASIRKYDDYCIRFFPFSKGRNE